MNTNNIFFSYSRDNSDFVLDLAKKLRKAGATVWLDQLDIATGERWDKSIETALQSSDILLLVLSKSSVESHNVMDEVSYALEEGKRVVPVLYEECDVPFRLRRLQFIDFTGDAEKGMELLSKALEIDSENVEAIDDSTLSKSSAQEETAPIKAAAQPKSTVSLEPSTSASKKRLPLYIGGAVIALLAVLYFTGVIGEDATEKELSEAIGKNTVDGYIDYIAIADSDYENVQEATSRLSKLLPELAQVVYKDNMGDPYFEKHVFTDSDGIIAKAPDDGNPPRVGDILIASRAVEVYHPETKELIDTEYILQDQKVLVEDVDLATSDGYIYIYVSYEVLSEGGLTSTGNEASQKNNTSTQNNGSTEAVTEAAATEANVNNGLNLYEVTYNDGLGLFEQTGIGSKGWVEQNDDGSRKWREVRRDASGVYLKNPGTEQIKLDVEAMDVLYSVDGGPWQKIYTITETVFNEN